MCVFCRRVRHDCGKALNEATAIMGYWVWSTQRTCHFNRRFAYFKFLVNGTRLSPEPAGRSFVFQFLLHCCRNLPFLGRGRVSFQFVQFFSNGYGDGGVFILCRVPSPTHSCQVKLDCFCTCDAFHNKIRNDNSLQVCVCVSSARLLVAVADTI